MYCGFNDSVTGKKLFEQDIVDGTYKLLEVRKKRFIVKWEKGSYVELKNDKFISLILVGSMFDANFYIIEKLSSKSTGFVSKSLDF